MLADAGCNSRYSKEKQADLFASRYKGQRMTVTGEVASADKGEVGIRMLDSTITYDIAVTLRDPKAAYDLAIRQRIRLSFTVSQHGGCILPLGGTDGVIESILGRGALWRTVRVGALDVGPDGCDVLPGLSLGGV